MFRYAIIAIALCIAVVSPLAALAGEMQGKVQSVNAAERTFTLDNGTTIWLGDAVAADSIKEGDEVTVSYDERDGKPVATSVTAK